MYKNKSAILCLFMSTESESRFSYLSEEEREKLSALSRQSVATEFGADLNTLKLHQVIAEKRDPETGIPLIEIVMLSENKDYFIPPPVPTREFFQSRENTLELSEQLSLKAHELALILQENSQIYPKEKQPGGVKWEDVIESPWGKLTITFNEEIDPQQESIGMKITEQVPAYDGGPLESTTFAATVFLQGDFRIKEYRGTEILSQALFTPDEFNLGNDTYRLADKTTDIMNHYILEATRD